MQLDVLRLGVAIFQLQGAFCEVELKQASCSRMPTTVCTSFGCRQLLLEIHNLLYLHQKPAVNLREVENLFDGEAGAEGVADEEDAFGVGHTQFAADDVAREDVAVAIDFRADAPGFAVAAQPTCREIGCGTPCAPLGDMNTLVGDSGVQRTARPTNAIEGIFAGFP